MTTDYIEVYRIDENNVGDYFSNPLRYFAEKNTSVKTIDVDNLSHVEYEDDCPIIVGGGGLIANEHFGENLSRVVDGADNVALKNMYDASWVCKSPNNEKVFEDFQTRWQKLYSSTLEKLHSNKGPKVIWGAGHNKQDFNRKTGMVWPAWLDKFTLIGMRDYMSGYQWVPCASCMHPAFDKEYEVTNDVIWFEHKKQLLKAGEMGTNPVPRFANSGNNFDQIISILGSAETVVTNSYHGVYWATLLNKRVVCVEPWSSKFYGFKHTPKYSRIKDWTEVAKDAKRYPSALEECRDANRKFWEKVKRL